MIAGFEAIVFGVTTMDAPRAVGFSDQVEIDDVLKAETATAAAATMVKECMILLALCLNNLLI